MIKFIWCYLFHKRHLTHSTIRNGINGFPLQISECTKCGTVKGITMSIKFM